MGELDSCTEDPFGKERKMFWSNNLMIINEQPHALVQAWGGPAAEQLCGEGPGCPGG